MRGQMESVIENNKLNQVVIRGMLEMIIIVITIGEL